MAISTAVSLVRGSGLLDTIGIIVAILLSTGIAFFNEYRSSREFDVLNAHRDDVAIKVIRDGHPASVPARDIVVGDLILLEAGDALPADGWVLAADAFFSDESAFTGETEPVGKDIGDRVLKGAFVTAGKGRMIAAAVGDSAEMGVIAASLGIDHATETPLEQKLEALAHLISRFGYAMAVLICSTLLIHGFMNGEVTGPNIDTANNVLRYFMLAVVIVVAAVPEGLPMSVALSLSLAMRKMTRANCLVRRLIACETIGNNHLHGQDRHPDEKPDGDRGVAGRETRVQHRDPADTGRVDHAQCCSERHSAPRGTGQEGGRHRQLDRGGTAPLAPCSPVRLPANTCRDTHH